MSVDIILKSLFVEKVMNGYSHSLLKKLVGAGFVETYDKCSSRTKLHQPGLTESDPDRCVAAYSKDDHLYDVFYKDASEVLKILKPSGIDLQIAKYFAWFEIWGREVRRLGNMSIECTCPTPAQLSITNEVSSAKTDEEILKIVQRFLTSETLRDHIWLSKSAEIQGSN